MPHAAIVWILALFSELQEQGVCLVYFLVHAFSIVSHTQWILKMLAKLYQLLDFFLL